MLYYNNSRMHPNHLVSLFNKLPEPHPQVFDSVSLRQGSGVWGFAFLTLSQAMLTLLVKELHIENHCSG